MSRNRIIGISLLAAAFAMIAVLPHTADIAKAVITGIIFCIAVNKIIKGG